MFALMFALLAKARKCRKQRETTPTQVSKHAARTASEPRPLWGLEAWPFTAITRESFNDAIRTLNDSIGAVSFARLAGESSTSLPQIPSDPNQHLSPVEIHNQFEQRRRRLRKNDETKKRNREQRGLLARGQDSYCDHRQATHKRVESKGRPYRLTLSGIRCNCRSRHEHRSATSWNSSPAEDGWDKPRVKPDKKPKSKPKSVTFAEPLVTRLEQFEEWWEDEYGISNRYHSRGRCAKSIDPSTENDDNRQIESMGGITKGLLASLRMARSNGIKNTKWRRAERVSKRQLKQANHVLDTARIPALSQFNETRHRELGEKRIGQRRKHKKATRVSSTPELESEANASLYSDFSEEVSASNPLDEEFAAEDLTASEVSGMSSVGDDRDIQEPSPRVEEIIEALDESNVKSPEIPVPLQQCAGTAEYGLTFGAQVHPLRALGGQNGPKRPRDKGPLYGGRCRWSPYPTRRRHFLACSEDELLIDDAVTEAAPEQELAFEADEAKEVPEPDEPLIDDATANSDLEKERALEADEANEVPVKEKLALHVAAGEAKVTAWWKALADGHDVRAAMAFTSGHQEPSTVEEAHYALVNAPMPDAEKLDEDSEMSDMGDEYTDGWLPDAPYTQGALSMSGFGAGLPCMVV